MSKEGGPHRPFAGRPCPYRLEHHVIIDRHGTPLAATLTSGNLHDVTQLLPLLDAVPPIRGTRGRPRRKPRRLYADRGYDFDNSDACCGSVAANPRSPDGASPTAPDWARDAGSSSAPSHGCTSSNDSAIATNEVPTRRRRDRRSPVCRLGRAAAVRTASANISGVTQADGGVWPPAGRRGG